MKTHYSCAELAALPGYPAKQADVKRREIMLIHVAKQQLGMDDETYRAMLWSVARVKSSTALDFAGRKKVLDHLKACGFKVVANEWAFIDKAVADRQPLLRKICMVCKSMGVGKGLRRRRGPPPDRHRPQAGADGSGPALDAGRRAGAHAPA